MEDSANALNQAIDHHRAGRLGDAEQIYQRILELDPDNANVWHLHGVVALQEGRQELAIARIERAICLSPTVAVFLNHLGEAYRALGRHEKAIANYLRAVELDPNLAAAHNNLGMVLQEKGQFEEARASYERAIALNPDLADAHNNLGSTLRTQGRLGEAIRCFQKAIAADLHHAASLNNLGLSLVEQSQLERAQMCFERSIEIAPDLAEAYYNYGNLLYNQRKFVEAGAAYKQAIRLKPRDARWHNNLGNALQAQGRIEEALVSFELAAANAAGDPQIHNNLGIALAQVGRFSRAEACFRYAASLDPSFADAFANLGKTLKAQAKLDAALTSFEQALSINSDHIGALVNLALTLAETARLDEAAGIYTRALTLAADVPEIHYNFGNLLYQQGKRSEAADSYRRAVALRPSFFEAHNNLGSVLKDLGLPEAIPCLERAVALNPNQVDLHVNLADALHRFDRPDEAAAGYRRALELDAACSAAHNGLGIILFNRGHLAQARTYFERAISFKPDFAQALNNLGITYEAENQLASALDFYMRALQIDAGRSEVHHNLGNLHAKLGRVEQAARYYQRAIDLDPTSPGPHNGLGSVFLNQGRLTEARGCFERALALYPCYPEAVNNLGNVWKSQGYFAEALECYRRAWKFKQTCMYAYSNYLFCLNYDPSQDNQALAAKHREWGERYGRHAAVGTCYSNERDPEKALRVGLVSPDFGRHPVGYFLAPLLRESDPQRVQYYCYSNRWQEDDLTARLRTFVHCWRCVKNRSDRELAELIRSDGIDVLIDLAGHTADNRLDCFAWRPAPVCVHWAGYCHSVPSVDFSIWDWIQVPKHEERWFVETIVRLPEARWCYEAPDYAPSVTDPPLLRRGYATFGSFNNLTKLNREVVELWSRVLQAVPCSRLLLSWRTLTDLAECERVKAAFAAHAIAPDRLELQPGAHSHAGVLGEYANVDIALDPFPFTGCLTTCEALWMGLPVVTLPRSRPASRQTQAFLTALGRTEWVARDTDDYIRIGRALAGDPVRLATFRREQRGRMRASPLCDGSRFAGDFEAALREMWRTWCATEAASS